MTNLATLLTDSAWVHGDRTAVHDGNSALTYTRLDD
jgi:non-ribosomal peptide synthetase component E (peptide arylation enzyme)